MAEVGSRGWELIPRAGQNRCDEGDEVQLKIAGNSGFVRGFEDFSQSPEGDAVSPAGSDDRRKPASAHDGQKTDMPVIIR
jgi:hypothetical protein